MCLVVKGFYTLKCCIQGIINNCNNINSFLNRSPVFHSFVKVALTKNPKKRPTAEKLLQVVLQVFHIFNLNKFMVCSTHFFTET